MDPTRALADLKEISSQIQEAALFGADGSVIASTFADDQAAKQFVQSAQSLLAAAEEVEQTTASQPAPLAQLEVATLNGSVFLVRDAEHAVVATTRPEPTVGLVFYDLKSCLRSAAAPPGDDGKPRPGATRAADFGATTVRENESAA
jgi:predicted regulator of Ras-like GTPase activity (Roadblock/LC7/MglB family)